MEHIAHYHGATIPYDLLRRLAATAVEHDGTNRPGTVLRSYCGSGNWDIYLSASGAPCDGYMGTVWSG